MKNKSLRMSLIGTLTCAALLATGYAAWSFGETEAEVRKEIGVHVTVVEKLGEITITTDITNWYLELDQGGISFKNKAGADFAESDPVVASGPIATYNGDDPVNGAAVSYNYAWGLSDEFEGYLTIANADGHWVSGTAIDLPTFSYVDKPANLAAYQAMVDAIADGYVYLVVGAVI